MSQGQVVYRGRTQSGKPGWFTNNFLAMPLSEADYAMPLDWHKARAERCGWVYDESRERLD